MECYLSAKVLFGVHVAGGSEGIIEQDQSISLNVKGQVRTKGEGKMAASVLKKSINNSN